MKEKNIVGLDLGPNSIGWAVVRACVDEEKKEIPKEILDAGCRIIPMDAAKQNKFAKGISVSQTADRTNFRSVRRLRERQLLRRERLHRVLGVMGFLPPHYAQSLTRWGKFIGNQECLLPWRKGTDGSMEFIFMESYKEMLREFQEKHPELMDGQLRIPYDWTVYYLRKKALTEPVSNQELAWILLQFNKKRGYYQFRSEEEGENFKEKREEYLESRIMDVIDSGEKKGKLTWWNTLLENGMVYRCTAATKPAWTGETRAFIVTSFYDPDGTPKRGKDGEEKKSIKMPSAEDWGLRKAKTHADLGRLQTTVGAYIYEALLANPKQKIIGEYVRTINRSFYKDELRQILESQKRFNPSLSDRELYARCLEELYPQNIAYRASIAGRDFTYLLIDDILFYQRQLKKKKSLIDDCPYESHTYINEQGEKGQRANKCIAKSHPLYQEFRLWQWIGNLRIYRSFQEEGAALPKQDDITDSLLPDEESKAALFDYLNDLPSITQKELLEKYFHLSEPKGKIKQPTYRWNYVEEKSYPCNSTRGEILSRLRKGDIESSFLTPAAEEHLWQILYSINVPAELSKALKAYARRFCLDEATFVPAMQRFPPFSPEYGAYSAKAIKRLLPLMRMGHHWREEEIDPATRVRIETIISGEVDENISRRTREKAIHLTDISRFRGLPLWLACYIVYNRHSESGDYDRWESPDEIDRYLKSFRQHSLRNPIVEQVFTETLRTVRDIWKEYGHIDEIHLEMGRDLKNPADKRAKLAERALQNENANLRVKALLTEFLNPEFGVENVRPYSPSQQELLRIYEDTALNSVDELEDDIAAILRKFSQNDLSKRPTRSEVLHYKLWLEQHNLSPYTGQPISLSRLFTPDYEIEHIIPQSRYFDDSLSNKVICEAEVNKLKGNSLGYEFIQKHPGEVVTLTGGHTVSVLSCDSYVDLVSRLYKNNPIKRKKLLLEDIPTDYIERQLNDSRHISRLLKGVLSHIVREENEQEATSKNLIVCNGNVTDRLKRDWGIQEVWNHLILPRFERMNELTGTRNFTAVSSSGHLIPDMPLELQKGFNKKRIDHRHHAMDAIVIACTSREHVNLISNEAALPEHQSNRYQLSRKLRRYETVTFRRNGVMETKSVAKEFIMPWPSFPTDVENVLKKILVSFKQNLRVINKTTNRSLHIVDSKKVVRLQSDVNHWAIRKSLHEDTVYGEVNLQVIKTVPLKEAITRPERIVHRALRKVIRDMLSRQMDVREMETALSGMSKELKGINPQKIEVYIYSKEGKDRHFAIRKEIDSSFDEKKIRSKVCAPGVQKIMLRHLAECGGKPELAFSPEGIDSMNRNIFELNENHPHQPILKARTYVKGDKFNVGQAGNKCRKFVEADKGTNLFFVVYESGKDGKKRRYKTIPLREAIEKMMRGESLDEQSSFILSPFDLVYIPTEEERERGIRLPLDRNRIYRFVSAQDSQAYFVPYAVAMPIQDGVEFMSHNKIGIALTGESIKKTCIPIKVNRLGHLLNFS